MANLYIPKSEYSPVLIDFPDFELDERIDWSHERTSVMLKNIPNKYTQTMLLAVLNECFMGTYDFFYLPIDFKNQCNVGYAFINFVHPYFAECFRIAFKGYKLGGFRSHKVCDVAWGRVQGFESNIRHYRNSGVMGAPMLEYRPIIFEHGIQVPFPPNDEPLPSITLRYGQDRKTGDKMQQVVAIPPPPTTPPP
eukprot:Platyproteum_vivax@DN6417_c0_g3_i1.p1